MNERGSRHVVAVVTDLFFATRISATADRTGVRCDLVAPATALAAIRNARPDLVILDLHAAADPLAVARALKADPVTRGLPLVGFYSHVDRDLRRAALAAGLDDVLPRSAFTARLAAILAGDRVPPDAAR